jgi:polyhydroxybutyrate depolymerase
MKQNLKPLIFLLLMTVFSAHASHGQRHAQIRKWKVGNAQREAIVYIPASANTKYTPVLFVFHGHGGNMKDMFYSHSFDQLWPEAIIVVPQGLKTPGKLVDQAGKYAGWQQGPGNSADRDIYFFDEMLKSLQNEYKINKSQIFATGHSNGGSFTYLLWAMRGNVLAGVAPSAAGAFGFEQMLSPKPVIHILCKNDQLVKPRLQYLQLNKLLKLNHCSTGSRYYAPNTILYPSTSSTPVAIYAHSGGHTYPKDADKIVVKFLKGLAL